VRQRKGAYRPEFRQQMVELVRVGRKPSALAQEFGCHETSISAWVRQAKADEMGGTSPDAPLTTAERQELAQLRRQLRQVTQERDILTKAGPSLPTRTAPKTRNLCADPGKPGRPTNLSHVQAFTGLYQRVLRLVLAPAQPTQHQ
jgi:transposase